MSLALDLPTELLSAARAIGILDADDNVNPVWFDDPMVHLRGILANPHQRAALFGLLESVAPSEAGTAGDGAAWHPLLDTGFDGNVYLTVSEDIVGFGARISAPEETPGATAWLSVPLIDLSSGAPVAIAGSGDFPIEIGFEARWPEGTRPTAVSVLLSVSAEHGGSVKLRLEGLDSSAPAGTTIELDPTALDGEAASVLAHLLAEGLRGMSNGSAEADRVAAHLPGLLGFEAGAPQLPFAEIGQEPAVARAWLAELSEDPDRLGGWFGHLAGLLGAGLPGPVPSPDGEGTRDEPLRVPLLQLSPSGTLFLTLWQSSSVGGSQELNLGLELELTAGGGRLVGDVTVLTVPLGATGQVVSMRAAGLALAAPAAGMIVDDAPTLQVGSITGGVRLEGGRFTPQLELTDVVLGGTAYTRLDLTSANAVADVASAALDAAIEAALGPSPAARALLALLGLQPPEGDPGTPHLLDLSAFAERPTRAVAEVHRAALSDEDRWRHLFAEVARLLGNPGTVAGDGTPSDPWRVPLAQAGVTTLELAAWNARADGTPAGTQLLRIGLRFGFDASPWSGAWQTELLGFDLTAQSSTARFVGDHHLTISLAPIGEAIGGGDVEIMATSLTAGLDWAPGEPVAWRIEAEDLAISGADLSMGPVDVVLSPATLDAGSGDLGLGIGAIGATAMLRLLLAESMRSWGGPSATVIAALAGLHRGLRGLPADWPLLSPPDPTDLGSFFEDPAAGMVDHLERVLAGASADGTPFVLGALPWLHALLTGQVPDRPTTTYPPGFSLRGAGTYERPWALPVVEGRLEPVLWFDPDGPPESWWQALADRIREAGDAAGLVTHLDAAGGLLPGVAAAIDGCEPATTATGIDRLDKWLATGDGVVPHASQLAIGETWTAGAPVAAAHPDLPADPAAIAQIRRAIDDWEAASGGDSAAAVILLAPPFADHGVWQAFLEAAEPGRSAGAHFDLRAANFDPLTVSLEGITAVATHYTADLVEADLQAMAAQLGRVVDRVLELTGAGRVYLVGHSTAGLVARVYAAGSHDVVAGIVTLGTPHGPSPLVPLVDPLVAGALRVADRILPDEGRTPVGRAVRHLAGVADHRLPHDDAFYAGLHRIRGEPPGLAIPGLLTNTLVDELVTALANAVSAAASSIDPPAYFGAGVRAGLDLPEGEPGSLDVDIAVRVDGVHRPLAGANGSSARPTPSLRVDADVGRLGTGWLVGGPEAGHVARLRRMALGATIYRAPEASTTVLPFLRLYDSSIDAVLPWIDLDDLLENEPNLDHLVSIAGTGLEAGSPEAFLVEAFEALGLSQTGGTAPAVSLEALGEIRARPIAFLGPRLPGLLDLVADAAGLVATPGSAWALPFTSLPVEVSLAAAPGRVCLRTHDPETGAHSLGLGGHCALTVDAELALPDMAPTISTGLDVAAATVSWSSSSAALLLAVPPWLAPVQLVPPPPADVLRQELGRHIPLVVGGALATVLLAVLAGDDARVHGVAHLLTAPGSWLISPEALGMEGGGFDPERVAAALRTIAEGLGLGDEGGIELPGGLTLTADGTDPLVLSLAGVLLLGEGGDTLELQVAFAIDANGGVSPSGSGVLRVGVAGGGWSAVDVEFGTSEGGLAFAVTPEGASRIELLPTFSGFGALVVGATTLLPMVLQAVVDELAPQPEEATGLLRAVLDLARVVGFYDFDAAGFREPGRVAELQRALEPGWLDSKASDASLIASAIAALLADDGPFGDLPGTVSVEATTVRWLVEVGAEATIGIELGWTDPARSSPDLAFEIGTLTLGPVVIDEFRIGYEGQVLSNLDLHVDAGQPLGFFAPGLRLGFVDESISLEILPLGAGRRDDLLLRLLPVPSLDASPSGPLALAEEWGVPFVALLLLDGFAAELDRDLWSGGPSARTIIEEAGIVRPASDPAALESPLPPPHDIALGLLHALGASARVDITPAITIGSRTESGRVGLEIVGRHDIDTGDVEIGLLSGAADFLDAEGGVLWLLNQTTGELALAPGIGVGGLGVELVGPGGTPLFDGVLGLPGSSGGTGLEVTLESVLLGLGSGGAPDVRARADLRDIRLVVSSDDTDSFVGTLLGGAVDASFDVVVEWQATSGVRFNGSTDLSVTIPVPVELGPFTLERGELTAWAGEDGVGAAAEIDVRTDLGPFVVVVGGLGLTVAASDGSGMSVSLRPPAFAGFSLDLPAVAGGGFIGYDPETGRYVGGLALDFLEVGLSAMTIIDTRLPDGGWAFLASLTLDLGSIPIGFGFTLEGVGGLVALNRSLDAEALAEGVRAGALSSLMFPEDIVSDMSTLVSEVDAYFPISRGSYVFGPMVKIGWGTPTLIQAELGIVLVLPDGLIAILGSVEALLPNPETPLLTLHMDTLGVIDLAEGTVSVIASLYDSNLAGVLELSGDMAFYATVSGAPYFLLSVGGFHPDFEPPAIVPASMRDLRRMRAELSLGENVSVSLESYFAVTSNTLQFGAALTLAASVDFLMTTYTTRGIFAFDVLLVFDPFAFIADCEAGVSVSTEKKELFGVWLLLHVEGPEPWYATGTATFRFFGLGVEFDFEVGRRAGTATPRTFPVEEAVLTALRDPSAWTEGVGPRHSRVFTRDTSSDNGPAWARPDRSVVVRQNVAPLDRVIDVYGNYVPAGANRFEIDAAGIGEDSETDPGGWERVTDWFAPAQYDVLTDEQKIAAPSFETMVAGVSFGTTAADFDSGEALEAPEGHLEYLLEGDQTIRRGRRKSGSAASDLVKRLGPREALGVQAPRFTVEPMTFSLRDFADPESTTDLADADLTYAAATRRAAELQTAAPDAALRIVPTHVQEAVL